MDVLPEKQRFFSNMETKSILVGDRSQKLLPCTRNSFPQTDKTKCSVSISLQIELTPTATEHTLTWASFHMAHLQLATCKPPFISFHGGGWVREYLIELWIQQELLHSGAWSWRCPGCVLIWWDKRGILANMCKLITCTSTVSPEVLEEEQTDH